MRNIILLVLFTTLSFSKPNYEFKGKHYIASLRKCEPAKLRDLYNLIDLFRAAVMSTGATVLNSNMHLFDNGAVTLMFLLSESHASIHTYPEHNSCFIDLFTCGDACDWANFHEVVIGYLLPGDIEYKVIERS